MGMLKNLGESLECPARGKRLVSTGKLHSREQFSLGSVGDCDTTRESEFRNKFQPPDVNFPIRVKHNRNQSQILFGQNSIHSKESFTKRTSKSILCDPSVSLPDRQDKDVYVQDKDKDISQLKGAPTLRDNDLSPIGHREIKKKMDKSNISLENTTKDDPSDRFISHSVATHCDMRNKDTKSINMGMTFWDKQPDFNIITNNRRDPERVTMPSSFRKVHLPRE
eukprot:GHVR01165131.1.p1 GENE.GHVR01165131.1~~GHVR01165131.1.p1  ORF type:complete len:223 (+),score=45.76 GHVR01165131.1:38-706(+)